MSDEKNTMTLDAGERFLCFSLGAEEYAMPLLKVREVIAMPDITPVPHTPTYFLGIMNLRGQVISILDLRKKLGIKPGEGAETSVIISDLGNVSLGLIVDSVNFVLAPQPGEVAGPPEISGQSGASDYLTGVWRKDKRLILFLDIAKALNVDDQKALKATPLPKAA